MMFRQRRLVLLARPHPMIVSEMQRFLRQNDYEPLPLLGLTEKPQADERQIVAGVISTSLTSHVHEPVEEVARRLRAWYPDLPLVIATIAERKMMGKAVARKLRSALGTAGVLDVAEVSPGDERLGRPDHVLLLHRSDLPVGDESSGVGLVLRRHLAAYSERAAVGLAAARP